MRPDFAKAERDECAKYWEPELVEKLLEGLRKAGRRLLICREQHPPSPGYRIPPPLIETSSQLDSHEFSHRLLESGFGCLGT